MTDGEFKIHPLPLGILLYFPRSRRVFFTRRSFPVGEEHQREARKVKSSEIPQNQKFYGIKEVKDDPCR